MSAFFRLHVDPSHPFFKRPLEAVKALRAKRSRLPVDYLFYVQERFLRQGRGGGWSVCVRVRVCVRVLPSKPRSHAPALLAPLGEPVARNRKRARLSPDPSFVLSSVDFSSAWPESPLKRPHGTHRCLIPGVLRQVAELWITCGCEAPFVVHRFSIQALNLVSE
jgi:hypothetical protein